MSSPSSAASASTRPRWKLLWESIRHSERRQLAARLRLTVRRQVVGRVGPWLERLPGARGVAPPVAAALPHPILPLRTHLARGEGRERSLVLLNRRVELPRFMAGKERPAAGQLYTLTLHYMEWLEALDDFEDRELIVILERWIDDNPKYQPSYWSGSWNAFAVSIRCVVWMQLFARRPRVLECAPDRVLASLYEQIRFLAANLEVDIRGNHLVKNVKCLLWGAEFFTGKEATQWRRCGETLLAEALAEQILPDGMHFERSPAYHIQVFVDLLECYVVQARGPLRERLGEALDRMAQVVADLCHPDGTPSHFSDGGLHMSYAPELALESYRALRGKKPSPRASLALLDSGYFGLRSEGELLLCDGGEIAPDHLPAHGHGDIFAFEWSLGGKRFIVDTGVFEYQGPSRAYSRSTAAHNTVTLDGLDQAEFWSAFRVARRPRLRDRRHEFVGEEMRLEAEHDGYAHLEGAPSHRRRFIARPGALEVEDRILGGAGQAVRAGLLLHPEVEVEERGEAGLWLKRGDTTLSFQSSAPYRLERGVPYYPDFGVKEETIRIELNYGNAPTSAGFSLRVSGLEGERA